MESRTNLTQIKINTSISAKYQKLGLSIEGEGEDKNLPDVQVRGEGFYNYNVPRF